MTRSPIELSWTAKKDNANCYKTKTFVLSLTNDHVVKESWKWKLLVSAIAFFFLLTKKIHNECCIALGTFCLLLDGSLTHQSRVKLSFIYVIQETASIGCLSWLLIHSNIAWIYNQRMQINLYSVYYLSRAFTAHLCPLLR